MLQMAIKYINIFPPKAPQNLPKLEFLVWKETIWQPCFQDLFTANDSTCLGDDRNMACKQGDQMVFLVWKDRSKASLNRPEYI
jgi:hypothetical protein